MRIPAIFSIVALTLVGPFLPGSLPVLPSELISNSYPDAGRKDSRAGDLTAQSDLSAPRPTDAELGPQAARERAALELIQFPWQELGYKVVFMGARPGYRGMTISATRRIEIYVRPGDTPRRLAYTLAHEFGHVIDLTHNTGESRSRWMQKRGLDPRTPWFGCNACSDYSTPAGDFAESFAAMLVGPEFYCGKMMPAPQAADVPDLAPFFKPLGLPVQQLQFASASDR